MTDRELLELAAKAAGIEGRYASLDEFPDWMTVHDGEGVYYTSSQAWNPLTDDGEALRLAVRLHLDINQYPVTDDYGMGMVEIWCSGDGDPAHVEYVKAGDDRLIATRRAIVRAAAEIGRNMK